MRRRDEPLVLSRGKRRSSHHDNLKKALVLRSGATKVTAVIALPDQAGARAHPGAFDLVD